MKKNRMVIDIYKDKKFLKRYMCITRRYLIWIWC